MAEQKYHLAKQELEEMLASHEALQKEEEQQLKQLQLQSGRNSGQGR
jgi:hypothetical protein